MNAENKIYSFIKNTALSIGCIVICILLLEAVLRYSSYDFYHSNRSSMEGRDDTAKDEKYIITLGDSFSAWNFCWPFKLNAHFSGEKKVINLAAAGTGPNIYYLTLQKYINDYKPEQIIIGLYVGNDFWDVKRPVPVNANVLYRLYYYFDNRLISVKWLNKKLGEFKAIVNSGKRESYTWIHKDMLKSDRPKSAVQKNRRKLGQIHKRQGKMFPEMYRNAILIDTEYSRSQFSETMAYMDKINVLARKYGTSVIMVIIPASAQVSDVYNEFYETCGYVIPDSLLHDDTVQSYIKEYCSGFGIKCIDLLPFFRGLNHTLNPIYYYNDMHLNPLGQTLAAEYIIKRLAENE